MPDVSRTMLAAYAVAAGIVLLAVGRWVGLRERPAEAPVARPTATVPVVRAPSGAGRLVVHVAGAVRRPGVYRLGSGARVRDAVERAGGPSRGADPAGVNLAAKLADGQQVIVPRAVRPLTGAAGAVAGPGGAAAGPVSLNAATAEQLDGLDGVGPATAEKILAWRREHGGFASVDDLGQIPGIGPKKLETLRGQVAP